MENLGFKAGKESLYEAVADRMGDMVPNSSLRQRERLPSEQELALKPGINRNVMRESSKLSKERQLIVQKNGEGTFIAKPGSGSVTRILSRMLRLNGIGYTDVYEMCELLESYTSRVMAERKDDLDFEELEQHLQGMIEGKDAQDKRTDYNIQLHIYIAEVTGNPLLICLINSMVGLWETILLRRIVTQQEGHQDGIEFHKKVTDSLKRGGPDEAEAVMKAHIRKSVKMYWVEGVQ